MNNNRLLYKTSTQVFLALNVGAAKHTFAVPALNLHWRASFT
jgi:hypothetical protein